MAAGDPILEARGIHAWYGSSHVLHGIDLTIARGETVGLLGRNGMGKSTLIRTLLGHVQQRDGRIHLFGQDVSKARPHEVARRGVAYVPEGRGVFPNLTVRLLLLVCTVHPRKECSKLIPKTLRIHETIQKARLRNVSGNSSYSEQCIRKFS